MRLALPAAGAFLALALCGSMILTAQDRPRDDERDDERPRSGEPGGRPGDGSFPGGFPNFFGGGGPPGMGRDVELVEEFDANDDGRLTGDELTQARDAAKSRGRRGPGGPGGRGGFPGFFGGGPGGPGGEQEAARPGRKIAPGDVEPIADAGFYDPTVLRTLFFDFPNDDWEAMLQDFARTDVEVPATLTVDGKTYRDVGVHFRGMSSQGVGQGRKHSLGVSIDAGDRKQRLYGYKTLNLLNAHTDPSFLRTVLYFDLVRRHIPAPKANFVRVVVNGENWGVYVNAQQFNKEFAEENYGGDKGARWKVSGSPNGRAGLAYEGENVEPYQRLYEIKSKDDEKSWQDLIALCRTLNGLPLDQLEKELPKTFDVEGALWFLAFENALINNDGYWIRASDYCIYQDEKGIFHVVPHDANETFQAAHGGPGMGFPGMGGPGGRGRGRDGDQPRDGRGPRDGQRPQGDRPQGDRPQGDRPQGDRPRGDEARAEFFPRENDRLAQADEPRGDRPRDGENRPRGATPRDGESRPEGEGREGRREREGRPEGEGRGGRGGFPGFPGGFPGFGGPGGGNVELDPLVGLDDASKPLRSRLLAVPAWRKKYLENVRTIAQEYLEWVKLKPVVDQYRMLISKEVEADTRKLYSFAAFESSAEGGQNRESRGAMPLKSFVEQRQKFLLDHPEIKALANDSP